MPTDQTVNVSGMRPWCWLQRMAHFMFVFLVRWPAIKLMKRAIYFSLLPK